MSRASADKNVSQHIQASCAVACGKLHLRAGVHLWHVSTFLCNREFPGISCYIKTTSRFHTLKSRKSSEIYNTFDKNSFVLSFFGCAKNSSGGASSRILP